MAKCRIEMQTVQAGAWAVPMWFCKEHAVPCTVSDTVCSVGKLEDAAETALARIDMATAEAVVRVANTKGK